MTRTLILFGAGPGIGTNVAATLAARSSLSHIILLGHNTARLSADDTALVQAAAPSVRVDVLGADLSDLSSLPPLRALLPRHPHPR